MKELTNNEFKDAPNIVKYIYVRRLLKQPVSASLFNEAVTEYPSYFPKEAEAVIKELSSYDLIDIKDWQVSYLNGKYNSYFCYNDFVIERSSGAYDGGDFNSWIPPTNYPALVQFCLNAGEIIMGMQEELEEKLSSIQDIVNDYNKEVE